MTLRFEKINLKKIISKKFQMDPILLIGFEDGLNTINIVESILPDIGGENPTDENIKARNGRPKNQNYFELTIPRYTDNQFSEHFRMSRSTFQVLVHVFMPLSLNII